MITPYRIHIYDDMRSTQGKDLFAILERLLPVKFIFNEKSVTNTSGEIILKDSMEQKAAGISKNVMSLSVPSRFGLTRSERQSKVRIKFADDLDVPNPYRGRILTTKMIRIGSFLSLHENERALAVCQHGPIWTVSEKNNVKHFRSKLPLPKISAKDNFGDIFNGESFLEMLPLIHFLREVCGKMLYKSPPLRASYIIDDPNLHWLRYGFVDYREIALHAQRENYHVSFATIPLDAWFAHSGTVNHFLKNTQWLSLLVHGNNHAKEELAANYSPTKRRALLQQAIQRIERLEQKTNLGVCRVMVPPHGACSNEMLLELPKFGFESACISIGSLLNNNRDKSWTKTLGYYPSEIIEKFPVLPRAGLTGNIENTLLVEAYLGRPMIFRCHHQDLKDGVEVLDEFAKFINRIGNVNWSNMTDLTRQNYLWRMEGTSCRAKPLSNKVTFQLPIEATELTIEGLNLRDSGAWKIRFADGSLFKILPGEKLPLMDTMGLKISLERADAHKAGPINSSFRPISVGFLMRRVLTTARDRLLLS